MPLAFLVLPLVKLLGQSTLGEQGGQDYEKEMYRHNRLQTEFFSNPCPGPLPSSDRWRQWSGRPW